MGGKDWAATTGCLGKEVKSEPSAQKTETMAIFMKRKKEEQNCEAYRSKATVRHCSNQLKNSECFV